MWRIRFCRRRVHCAGPKGLGNLAQGGGFAEPWVSNINTRIALKERKRAPTSQTNVVVLERWSEFL